MFLLNAVVQDGESQCPQVGRFPRSFVAKVTSHVFVFSTGSPWRMPHSVRIGRSKKKNEFKMFGHPTRSRKARRRLRELHLVKSRLDVLTHPP